MLKRNFFVFLFLSVVLLLIPGLLFAEESITVTTYYPSPMGSYSSLQTDKLGVGDNNGNGSLDSADIPTTAGDVWIKGNVSIGTTTAPAEQLEVRGDIRTKAPSTSGWSGTYLGLFTDIGSLPGYPTNTYATLKTDGSYIGFSAGGLFSAHINSAGTYTAVSDKNKKENFVELNTQEILSKIDQLPITQWNFKCENSTIKHIGPTAQDFHALFGLNGDDDKMISHIDPSGVALVGIKALSKKFSVLENGLKIDPTNGNVGIGTGTLAAVKLNVAGQIYQNSTGTKMIFKKPDGSCSACGPDNSNVWSCVSSVCP